MKNLLLAVLLISLLIACNNDNQTKSQVAKKENDSKKTDVEFQNIDTDEALILTALKAAPEYGREKATVIGYNMEGDFVTLKEGDNEFICLADNPNMEGFSVACYHKSLAPFMARGRELKAEGKNGNEIFDIREEEIKSGELVMGEPGSTLHIYFGPEAIFNPVTGAVPEAKYRYVVYIPFATSESTGLPENPIAPNHPWIMNPGTHRAHIMISPLAGEEHF